jgi:hypothetical protein
VRGCGCLFGSAVRGRGFPGLIDRKVAGMADESSEAGCQSRGGRGGAGAIVVLLALLVVSASVS